MSLRNEQGIMAIGTAMMLIVVLSLFASVLWQFSMFEMKQVTHSENDLKALYLAQAGAEAAMAVWLEKPFNEKPYGKLSRVYYDNTTKEFTLDEPKNFYGYFDAIISYIDDEENEKHGLTEITSTAKVGNMTRTVTVPYYQLSPRIAVILSDSILLTFFTRILLLPAILIALLVVNIRVGFVVILIATSCYMFLKKKTRN